MSDFGLLIEFFPPGCGSPAAVNFSAGLFFSGGCGCPSAVGAKSNNLTPAKAELGYWIWGPKSNNLLLYRSRLFDFCFFGEQFNSAQNSVGGPAGLAGWLGRSGRPAGPAGRPAGPAGWAGWAGWLG